jgi:hypothetical protein
MDFSPFSGFTEDRKSSQLTIKMLMHFLDKEKPAGGGVHTQ